MRGAIATGLALLAGAAHAQDAAKGHLQPSLGLFGVAENTGGPAYTPPTGVRPDVFAPAVSLGLDGRRRWDSGSVQATGFALGHDPFSDEGRGLFAAARLRGHTRFGAWRLLVDDSARLQRRQTGPLGDFERNDIVLGLERVRSSGGAVGLRVGDRRRSVSDAPELEFERQSIAASMTWGRPTSQWRVEAGPQRYSADTTSGWRLGSTLEWAGRVAGWTGAIRLAWLEPLDGAGHGRETSAAFPADAAPPIPVPAPTAAVPAGPLPTVPATPPVTPATETRAPLPGAAPVREGLLGPSLIVDPLEDDEGDWDFGRRKQEIVAFISRSLGARASISAELRADIERGPDRLSSAAEDIRRERLAARVHVRHRLGTHWIALAQAGGQRVHDSRAGLSYTRGLLSIGLEIRP